MADWHLDEIAQLDRLVDGELSSDDRQRLLAHLDQTPDGWRRCALAFLEAQTWHESLADAVRKPPALPTAARRHIWQVSFPAASLALAASFVIAFSLALLVRGELSRPSSSTQLAHSPPTTHRDHQVATASSLVPIDPADNTPSLDDPESSLPSISLHAPPEHNAPPDEVPLVIVPWSDDDTDWTDDDSIVPDKLVQALQRAGHRLYRQPDLLPIELSDGTRGLIPIERIELQYVGSQFQ